MPRLRAAYSPANPPPTTTTRCGSRAGAAGWASLGRSVGAASMGWMLPARGRRDLPYLSRSAALVRTAWAAASRATGTRNGEQET